MRYLGGKARVAPKFAPLMQAMLQDFGGRMLEPFVGGFNIVPTVSEHITHAICSDLNQSLITMYRELQAGRFTPPDTLTEAEYQTLRAINDPLNPLTAFASIGCSFAGIEWRAYARDSTGGNYAGQASRSLLKKRKHMDNVTFSCGSYLDYDPQNVLVYCDPPYAGTTGYKTGAFNHAEFYAWCEQAERQGCVVLVSEFAAPVHWLSMWQKTRKISVRCDSNYAQKTEHLFWVASAA